MTYDAGSIEQGTIGWGDDEADHFDIGEGEEENLSLIRVTLVHGKRPGDDVKEEAQGNEILCRWGCLIDWIPPKGTQCIVAFPSGMREHAGGGVIIGVIKPNGSQFKEKRAVLNLGEDVHVLVKGKSVTLSDFGSGLNTPTRYIMVGTSRGGGAARILCNDETGSGWTVKAGIVGLMTSASGAPKAWIELTSSGASMALASGEQLKLGAGLFYGYAGKCQLQGGGVFLGKMPTPITPVCVGPVGMTAIGSGSVFASIT